MYRGSSSLADYCTTFQVRFETAAEKAGLQLNNVGKAHLFLKHAGLTQKFIDDIYFKINGDRTQFQEVFNIVQKTAKQHQNHPDDTFGHILLTEAQQSDTYYGTDDTSSYDDDCDSYDGYNNVEYFTDING